MNITLNAYLAQAGICSRRKAVDLIKDGRVTIDGQVVTQPGRRVAPGATVCVNGEPIISEDKVYILFNKPNDVITTVSDERGRKTVLDCIKGIDQRLFPVGRLDRATTGLLLLTNDGQWAQRLAHPKFEIEKVYRVTLSKPLHPNDFQAIAQGIELEDGSIKVDALSHPDQNRKKVRVVLHSGRNRIVRRIFENLGYDIKRLDRSGFAGLSKKGLPVGQWRHLTPTEVAQLTTR